jgi:nucleotide-binding universal stress UspA family protein
MSTVDLHEHVTTSGQDTPVAGVTADTAGMLWKPATLLDRILVATDGSRAGGAALRMARELVARKRGSVGDVRVVTVLHRPAPAGMAGFVLGETASVPSYARSSLSRIRRQIRSAGLPGWELHVEFGSPARAICRAAKHTASTLVIIGIGRHTPTARLFGADTARRVVANADVSVLSVAEDTPTLGHSAVVAVDFSAASARVARAAMSLLEPPANLHLVHVRPRLETAPPEMEGYQHIYMSGVEAALGELRSSLPKVDGITVGSFVITGAPDTAILDFARRLNAGFIAAGRHGHGIAERLLIGSTTNALLARAECPILTTPPAQRTSPRA